MNKKLLGYVGVDSGQLMVCDPCYLESEWKNVPFQDIRIYKHNKTKKLFVYLGGKTKSPKKIGKSEAFANYNSITSNGKTMNEMEKAKEVTQIDVKAKSKLIGSFSYAGVCETTLADKHQINYKLGHPGVAVAFCSGYGDGCYPVSGIFNKEGRCMKVEIDCGMTKPQH
ncbi:MAG: hypothetical protein V1920_06930 [Bacillota bacterium]